MPDTQVWNFSVIEDAFSDAAIDATAWARSLNVVTAQTEAFGAILAPVTGSVLPNVPFSDRMRETLRTDLRGERHVQDEHNRGVKSDKIKNTCLHDLLASTDLGWRAKINAKSGDDLWCLSIQRSMEQKPFSAEEQRKLAGLSQSLSLAVTISRAIGLATTKAALDAFEISDTAVLLIDRLGRIIRANQSAEQLLKGDVKLSRGKLVSKDQNASRVVEQALQKLLGTSEVALPAPIPLPRNWQRPLLVYLLKLSSLSGNPLSECQAIAVLIDPDRRWVPTEMILQASFGFTPAEARLAARISSGEAIDTAVESLGISKKTGRNQLLSVFGKAGVHRQAELVALVGSTANAPRGTLDTPTLTPKSGRHAR